MAFLQGGFSRKGFEAAVAAMAPAVFLLPGAGPKNNP
jgi:hypothetical protein